MYKQNHRNIGIQCELLQRLPSNPNEYEIAKRRAQEIERKLKLKAIYRSKK